MSSQYNCQLCSLNSKSCYNTADIKPAKFCEQFEVVNSINVFNKFDKFLTVFLQAGLFFTAFEPTCQK